MKAAFDGSGNPLLRPCRAKPASLRDTVDRFFTEVMVNAEDAAVRRNRLTMLVNLRALFLAIADISQLQ